MKTSIHIQFRDDVNVKDVENTVKEALKAEGLKISSLKQLDIYYKPQENAIYYVAIDEDIILPDLIISLYISRSLTSLCDWFSFG